MINRQKKETINIKGNIKGYDCTEKNVSGTITLLMLVSRMALFLFFQTFITLLVRSWETSQKYWLLTATLTNIVSIAFLVMLFRHDGTRYLSIFSFNRASFKKDIWIFLGLALLSGPLVFIPGNVLGKVLWGDPNIPTEIMFQPIDKWLIYILMIAFPVTIALAELANYFMYVMPKLKEILKIKWLAVLLPVLFLSIQHCTLPFIPDIQFIIYRGLVFLPFAALIGISLYYRPSLFIYFAILHGLMDFGTACMFLFDFN
jgi:hypothetical protein